MRNKDCWKPFDNSPKGGNKDCTTRCISYCLGVEYKAILSEQRRITRNTNEDYRLSSIWDLPLVRRGWFDVSLNRKMRRHEVAARLSTLKHPVATLSAGHVCPVHRGYVMDNIESQNQWVHGVVCREKDVQKVKKMLEIGKEF
jgi:hypothetical protein